MRSYLESVRELTVWDGQEADKDIIHASRELVRLLGTKVLVNKDTTVIFFVLKAVLASLFSS